MLDKLKILLATGNTGKVRELRELMADSPVQPVDLTEFPHIVEPEETGSTFLENAELKAKSYSLQTGLWALADDSGLEVEALNGAPGVFSARYAGANAGNEKRIKKLLDELGNTESRRARFVCVMAVADENGTIKFNAEGICNGSIAFRASGEGGFGYDPIFIPDGFSETFGELPNEVKQQISHRKRAIVEIIQQIRRYYDDLT